MSEPVKQLELSHEQCWSQICDVLKQEIGESAFKSWISPLSLGDFKGSKLVLVVPTKFMSDWVKANYEKKIIHILKLLHSPIQEVVFQVVGAKSFANANTLNQTSDQVDAATGKLISIAPNIEAAELSKEEIISEGLDASGAKLDQRFTFDNFVVGKSNELAHAAARRVADADQVTFNPLFLYGGVGLGKTHLMHSIAWHIRTNSPGRKVLYLSAEKFMYQFIRALRFKDTMSFKEQFRSVDVLMIDDVQFIGGKESTQEEFFHTFNALVDQNRQVIISADKSPSDLEGMEDRLKSRLGWGLVADIHPTTYELRLGILQSKADNLGVSVPIRVMEFLAHKITSSIRELEGALNRIVAHSDLIGAEITLDSTQNLLKDLLRANDRKITIDEIQRKVAEHFMIRVSEMNSSRRSRSVARPRQIAMYLSKHLTGASLPEIGRKYGGRDHTTVMHAIKTVQKFLIEDMAFSEDVELLKRMLQN